MKRELTSPKLLFELASGVLEQTVEARYEPVSPGSTVPLSGWTASVEFVGAHRGAVKLRVPSDYAEKVTGQLMGGELLNSRSPLIGDAIGELANILAGTLVAHLFGRHQRIEIKPPKVSFYGGKDQWTKEGALVVGLLVDSTYVVQVCLELKDEPTTYRGDIL